MGILSDRLPDSVTVAGSVIPLETDFRRWILFTELMSDEGADSSTKLRCAAEIVCREPKPVRESMDGAFETEFFRQLAAFALMSEPPDPAAESTEEDEPGGGSDPAFDFEIDGGRICAAFLQCYGVDLCDEGLSMHWWKFLTLLRHLPSECEFMRVVALRCADLSRISDDEARRTVRRAKAAVRIRRRETRPESRVNDDVTSLKGVISHG